MVKMHILIKVALTNQIGNLNCFAVTKCFMAS